MKSRSNRVSDELHVRSGYLSSALPCMICRAYVSCRSRILPMCRGFPWIPHAELKDIVFVVGGTPIERTGRIQESEVILAGFQVEAIGNQGAWPVLA